MAFLPDSYEIPQAGGKYFKFKPGENRFRALSDAVVGWEYWVEAEGKKKPIRVHEYDEVPAEYRSQTDTRAFWAFLVFDYNPQDPGYKILEITQKGIMRTISTYIEDPDWGDPKGYDIVVKKVGSGIETEYDTSVKPIKPFASAEPVPQVNINALFDGADPFTAKAEVEEELLPDETVSPYDDLDGLLPPDEEVVQPKYINTVSDAARAVGGEAKPSVKQLAAMKGIVLGHPGEPEVSVEAGKVKTMREASLFIGKYGNQK